MISVISGKYKGQKLNHLKNLNVRPTQAKVRKSVFQILEPFNELAVLDLYAGVGTLGIEAISRGASRVIFVENNRQVFKILKKNVNLFDPGICDLFLNDALNYIDRLNKSCFDIVFADPPYSELNYELLKNKVLKILKPGGVFCMEMKKQQIELSDTRIKYYGNTQVVFWEAVA